MDLGEGKARSTYILCVWQLFWIEGHTEGKGKEKLFHRNGNQKKRWLYLYHIKLNLCQKLSQVVKKAIM